MLPEHASVQFSLAGASFLLRYAPRGARDANRRRPSGATKPGFRAARSVRFPCFPYLFAGPLPGPFQAGERVLGGRSRRGPQLDEVLDLEAAAAQQPDHVTVADVELHRVGAQ